MTFTLTLSGEYLQPAVTCDRCGVDVAASGYQLWRAAAQGTDSSPGRSAQLCGDDCLEAWVMERADGDEWLATPIDAYLANLVRTLGIDVAAVLERERAVSAAEHTRHEAPD